MSKGKEFIVSWDDLDDDDLFDEDPIEPSQGQSAPAKDDATPTAAAVAPARIFRKPESANSTPTNEPYVSKQDLRNENKQLSTSSSNINTPGRFRSVSGTRLEGCHQNYDTSDEGSRISRNSRNKVDQNTSISSIGIRYHFGGDSYQFGPQAVIILGPTIRFGRDCSTTKTGQLSTEESLRESLKRQGVQESQKVQESVKGAVVESVKKAVVESIQRQSKKSVQGSIMGQRNVVAT
ncbi:hypothetical protein KI688_001388 [Linnemannia hyalina]|uniref:Uncharacterized protein n=1 Tax=Linnemannia hyalina TaxID=64524 RepID=A0A9P7XRZ9_9FUNG|nr:hypothetical protein KI688_001388 [Linnemannia hyalina]